MSEFRKRILEPLSLPLFAAAFVAALVFSLSRILLAIPEKGSTTIALMIAAEVLGVAAVLSAGSRLKAAQRALLILTGVALIGGGTAAASLGTRAIEQLGVEVAITAKDIKFVETHVVVPANTEVSFKFINNDAGVPHNVDITKDDAGTQSVAKSNIFNGIASQTFKATLPVGNFFYHCDVHPTMKGTLESKEGAKPEALPPSAGGPGPTTSASSAPSAAPSMSMTETAAPAPGKVSNVLDITALNITDGFRPSEAVAAASTKITLHFQNEDNGVPHNVNITSDEAGTKSIFKTDIITGVAHKEYTFTSPAAGNYFFHCDVHPNMKGKVQFK
jgi:plastocyanin